ncbi:MAG TPA: DUF1376 domain-containing protein [Rhizobiaceae bacterium]|nr:DUF1376 domain-containing protein [Rhizobiaceae bacterium]
MSKKRWFRFHIDAWFKDTTGLSPCEIAVYITVLCELYDHDGFAPLDVRIMARRCGMRQSTFRKALDALIARGKLSLEAGFLTSKAVSEEIEKREKLVAKVEETRRNRAEKLNEINENRQNVSPYTESRVRIQKPLSPVGALHPEADARPVSTAMLDFIQRREQRRRGQS